MINKTFVYTSIFAALFMAFALKFLHLFDFIKWSPVGWAEKWSFFPTVHYSIKWFMLILAFTLIFAILYILLSFLDTISPSISAILFTVLIIVIAEWAISEPKSPVEALRTISIPLLSITAIVLRFIAGTAVFMKKLSKKDETSSDKTPSMIK